MKKKEIRTHFIEILFQSNDGRNSTHNSGQSCQVEEIMSDNPAKTNLMTIPTTETSKVKVLDML